MFIYTIWAMWQGLTSFNRNCYLLFIKAYFTPALAELLKKRLTKANDLMNILATIFHLFSK